jgi:hypothetical protein
MPRFGFEPTTPVQVKTVQALDRAASVIGLCSVPYRCTCVSSLRILAAKKGTVFRSIRTNTSRTLGEVDLKNKRKGDAIAVRCVYYICLATIVLL